MGHLVGYCLCRLTVEGLITRAHSICPSLTFASLCPQNPQAQAVRDAGTSLCQRSLSLWLLANHLPSAIDASIGFWRRIKVIPFDRTFSSEEMDRGLSAMLSSEAEGILAWLVDGAFDWHKMKTDSKGGTGLGACRAIDQTTDIYHHESDVFGLFLNQVSVNKVGAETSTKDLFKAYLHWCETERNETPCTQKIFGGRLDERGFKKKRKNDGIYYKDIRVEDDFRDIKTDI